MRLLPLISYVLLISIAAGLPLGLFTHPIRIRRKPR